MNGDETTMKTTTINRRLALFVAIIMVLGLWTAVPLRASADPGTPITVGDFTITADDGGNLSDTDYTYAEGVLTIKSDKAMTISMKADVSSTTADTIVIDSENPAYITIENVKIDVSETTNACAFDVGTSTLNLTLSGANVLKSNGESAGLQVKEGAAVIITSVSDNGSETGTLQAFGGQGNGTSANSANTDHSGARGAGIGAPMATNAGTITINGGTIEARGG
jgi:hypothetical protein